MTPNSPCCPPFVPRGGFFSPATVSRRSHLQSRGEERQQQLRVAVVSSSPFGGFTAVRARSRAEARGADGVLHVRRVAGGDGDANRGVQPGARVCRQRNANTATPQTRCAELGFCLAVSTHYSRDPATLSHPRLPLVSAGRAAADASAVPQPEHFRFHGCEQGARLPGGDAQDNLLPRSDGVWVVRSA